MTAGAIEKLSLQRRFKPLRTVDAQPFNRPAVFDDLT